MESGKKNLILVVEDDPAVAETVVFALGKAGYNCSTAVDGEEGIRLARELHPDLILLDVMLPKFSGFHVSRILKADSSLAGVPIVMVTARAQERDYLMGKDTGADDYVTKPFELDDLLEVVARHLSHRTA